MILINDSTKRLTFVALLGVVLAYVFCQLTLDGSNQNQKILALEAKIQHLDLLLAQKDDDLRRARFAGFQLHDNSLASVKNSAETSSSSTHPQQANQTTNHQNLRNQTAGEQLNSFQVLKDLGTQSINDPRSFSEKVNDFLAADSSKEKIAIVSNGIFNMAGDRENLPDYALQAIYNNQADPDLKRVIAQVLSLRGNNALLETQIFEAQAYLESENPTDRQHALTNLAKTHHVTAANTIAPLLNDSDINVKLDALLAIRATGNQTHVHLVEKLLNDPDPTVSSLASDVISNLANLSEIARTSLSNADIASELIPVENM